MIEENYRSPDDDDDDENEDEMPESYSDQQLGEEGINWRLVIAVLIIVGVLAWIIYGIAIES